MFRRLALITNLAVVAALFVSAGAHLAVLQSVAWTKMLLDYSEAEGFVRAVEKTFDGKHPCELCVKVLTTEHEQQQEKAASPAVEIKGVIAPGFALFTPVFSRMDFASEDSFAERMAAATPDQPPRA